MVRGYLLIQVEAGRARAIEDYCRDLESSRIHIEDLAVVLGPYSLVVVVEADDRDVINRFVERHLQHLDGLTGITTCFAERPA